MELRDFKVGDRFYTGSGSWICVDVGSRSILAVKELVSYLELYSVYHVMSPKPNDIVKYYDMLPTMTFFPDDFGGCSKQDRFSK